uniref:Uncharacterized protein n=1 Tax=Lotus japonicus TaxID=34305 RepID=I3SV40_LOTJA|nr:unknown [Lotus japonicus]
MELSLMYTTMCPVFCRRMPVQLFQRIIFSIYINISHHLSLKMHPNVELVVNKRGVCRKVVSV